MRTRSEIEADLLAALKGKWGSEEITMVVGRKTVRDRAGGFTLSDWCGIMDRIPADGRTRIATLTDYAIEAAVHKMVTTSRAAKYLGLGYKAVYNWRQRHGV